MKKKTFYVVINLDNFEIDLFRFKNEVADKVRCHVNSLIGFKGRKAINNYLVVILLA